MADTTIPAGVSVQRFNVEFMQPAQWDKHCRIEIEWVNRHNVPGGATLQPASRHAAIALVSQLITQAKADF
jgi:hypothetical protein